MRQSCLLCLCMMASYRAVVSSRRFSPFIIQEDYEQRTSNNMISSGSFRCLEMIMFYDWHLVCDNVSFDTYGQLDGIGIGRRRGFIATFLQGMYVDTRTEASGAW